MLDQTLLLANRFTDQLTQTLPTYTAQLNLILKKFLRPFPVFLKINLISSKFPELRKALPPPPQQQNNTPNGPVP